MQEGHRAAFIIALLMHFYAARRCDFAPTPTPMAAGNGPESDVPVPPMRTICGLLAEASADVPRPHNAAPQHSSETRRAAFPCKQVFRPTSIGKYLSERACFYPGALPPPPHRAEAATAFRFDARTKAGPTTGPTNRSRLLRARVPSPGVPRPVPRKTRCSAIHPRLPLKGSPYSLSFQDCWAFEVER